MNQTTTTKIGRFEVLRRLGAGFQGKVYLAWDPRLQRQVALKVITLSDAELTDSKDVVDEARMAASISHPNVIPIYEADMYHKLPLLVFEFVDGVTLGQYLEEHGPCSEQEALSLMLEITAGLACAHEQGIVHLDLSPNNIMIDRQGRARIMDFGLARITAAMNESYNCGRVFGTPRYITPDHIARRGYTTATDIFSLGLLFYELLTGTEAIVQSTMEDILKAIEEVDIDWAKLQFRGLTPEIIGIVRDMLQVDPSWRYKSANELLPSLQEVVDIQQNENRGLIALDFLMRRLDRRPEFPSCSHSIAEINRLTEEESNTDFNKLGAVIVRDYTLTNRVLKIANSVIFDRGSEGVKTISLAIARLGLKLVRMICNGLLLFKQVDDKDSDLKDILVASFVAGLIARHVCSSINRRLAEEAFICALFHNLGKHLLVFYLPDEYEDIEALIAGGMGRGKAERAILSTSCAALGVAVAEKWNFPETISKCMMELPPGKLEASNNDEDVLCHAANFANELCELFAGGVEGDELLSKIEIFGGRHQALISADAGKYAQIASATGEKFSELAPGLGVNYNDSKFCKKLGNFASAIDMALAEEELFETLAHVAT